ncbi:uncharacterized protein TRIADDRAFT_54611 [Trichoplax adhaerens]|uniref:Heparan-alpha-glucosaminide N-acetyltransferase catalytic domain-containing protein n=1 Tax=Trichoplax adhaerens TaxID=10228 RepID=B3RSI7_TRIAD|nr:hypothetical protein TRIADDRAFT_54611 [Trichoplax adhaerens]EDV27066.1 hypothetical protein TRIADDRAFT_54611 [Trichoplax adhaerens]|eukprot:XP_002111062.1 hypothetical protein TRIADDRAFT_54611 [Trichoplax adhaerens]
MTTTLPQLQIFGATFYSTLNVAQLLIYSPSTSFSIYARSSNCYRCSYENIAEDVTNTTIYLDTNYPIDINVLKSSNKTFHCQRQIQFQEGVRYLMFLDTQGDNYTECTLRPLLKDRISVLDQGLMLFACVIAMNYILWHLLYPVNLKRNLYQQPHIDNLDRRIRSLDLYRGLCAIVMAFGDSGGGQYRFFKHSIWNGLTIVDVVFPGFIFISGFSLSISLVKRLYKMQTPKLILIVTTIRRSFYLFFLGLLINGPCQISNWRLLGVLQRISVTFLVVSCLAVWLYPTIKSFTKDQVLQEKVLRKMWPIMVLIVGLHTYVTLTAAVPDCPVGYSGPGGKSDDGKYYNCTGGIAGFIDRFVFGSNHLYSRPTCKLLYQSSQPFDPEGVLGTLTSIFLCFLGLQMGILHNIFSNNLRIMRTWILFGLLLVWNQN